MPPGTSDSSTGAAAPVDSTARPDVGAPALFVSAGGVGTCDAESDGLGLADSDSDSEGVADGDSDSGFDGVGLGDDLVGDGVGLPVGPSVPLGSSDGPALPVGVGSSDVP